MSRKDGRDRRAYSRWRNMVGRCTNPGHKDWKWYGGRGITVCPEWLDFKRYYADVGDAPPGLTLDRTNNDGNYEPGNVRWATRPEQNRNRRSQFRDKARCPANHPFDEANTYVWTDGWRACRTCRREAQRRYRERLAVAS